MAGTRPELSTRPATGTVPSLTARERDVLALLPSPLTLRELGNQLFVSRNTVKTHVADIYQKLGVSSRSAAVTRASDLGLL
jgi:LuxR family maltose regulon positive regulatory protein